MSGNPGTEAEKAERRSSDPDPSLNGTTPATAALPAPTQNGFTADRGATPTAMALIRHRAVPLNVLHT